MLELVQLFRLNQPLLYKNNNYSWQNMKYYILSTSPHPQSTPSF